MAARTRRRTGPKATCAYCGLIGAQERDHIPSQSIYAHGRPSNLITVPTCALCHRATSSDDEYFRLVMVTRREAAELRDVAGGVLDSAMRGLERPEAQGLTSMFLRSVRTVAVRSPAGLDLGEVAPYESDPPRIMAVVERIVRGLYFYQTGRSLGATVGVRSMEDRLSDFSRMAPGQRTAVIQIVQAVAGSEWWHIGRAFSYACLIVPGDPVTSAWLTRFYRATTFLTLTRLDPPLTSA